MLRKFALLGLAVLFVCSVVPLLAQQATTNTNSTNATVVPPLVNFRGLLTDQNGKPLSGLVGVTFALYKDAQGGAPLWQETQNVQADKTGHYSVVLGSTASQGIPATLFASGEARWVGVQPQGQPEQPRVLMMSVPYAMKAVDAQTVGGLPASAFVRAAPPATSSGQSESTTSAEAGANPPSPNVSGSGTKNYVPLWMDNIGTLGNSIVYQSGTGSTAKVGINTTTPASTLDIKGGGTVRGLFALPASGGATASKGFNSQAMKMTASVFNSGTATAVPQNFQWQAEPVGNNTANATASLNLLFAQGTNKVTETGFNIANNGVISFAANQTFPGTGTVTSVGSGAGLTGGPITQSGTLSVATGGIVNTMLQNPFLTINPGGGMTGGGKISLGSSATLGLMNCGANQILQFISGAWSCASSATGTVTSVGLSAPVGDFTVSGSPVTQSGTLGLGWGSTGPTSLNTANAIVRRDSTGSFNVTNLSAVGSVMVNTPSVSAVWAQTSNASGTAVEGNAIASSGFGTGVYGYSSAPSGEGVSGYGTGTAVGVVGVSNQGIGIWGSATDLKGTAGVFSTFGNGKILSGVNSSTEVFSVGGDGTLKAAGPVIGPYGAGTPLAFASVASSGAWQSGSANCTSAYNSTSRLYEITINGVNFDRTKYTTVATISGYNGIPLFIYTGGSGKLVVGITDPQGNPQQADFQVVVFQAGQGLKAADKQEVSGKHLPIPPTLRAPRLP